MRILLAILLCASTASAATTTIAHTSIEDGMMVDAASTTNWGGSTAVAFGVDAEGPILRGLIRVDETQIPAGTINSATLYMYRTSADSSTVAGDLSVYSVKAANAWVEGSSDGAPEVGAYSWDDVVRGTSTWDAGGCGTSGTDYDATAIGTVEYAAYAAGGDVLFAISLTPAIFTAWRDATHANEGMMIKEDDEATAGKYVEVRSTENGSNEPYVIIDYTPPGSATTTISGTTDIEDATIGAGATADNNYGSNVAWVFGISGADPWRTLIRVDETKIPAGGVTGFRLVMYRKPSAGSTGGGILNAFRVKAANDWVEGTNINTPQAGSCDWNHAKHDTQNWAGGNNGCGTSGTDYYADGDPPAIGYPAYTAGANVLMVYTLPVGWASDWRDSVIANEGLIIKTSGEAGADLMVAVSTEEAADQPYFEIDIAGSFGIATPIMMME